MENPWINRLDRFLHALLMIAMLFIGAHFGPDIYIDNQKIGDEDAMCYKTVYPQD